MTADPMIHCGRGICAAEEGHAGTCDEASGWAEEESDVRPVSPAQDAVSDAEAAEWARLAAEATEGPWVVDLDGSIGAPMAGLVCFLLAEREALRAEVERMREGADETPNEPGVWATPAQTWARLLSFTPALRLAWIEAMQERAQQHVDPDGLSAERDRARSLAARLEAENARLREGIESMMRDVGKAQPAHVTPGIVAVRLKALLAEDEGGE